MEEPFKRYFPSETCRRNMNSMDHVCPGPCQGRLQMQLDVFSSNLTFCFGRSNTSRGKMSESNKLLTLCLTNEILLNYCDIPSIPVFSECGFHRVLRTLNVPAAARALFLLLEHGTAMTLTGNLQETEFRAQSPQHRMRPRG